MRPPVGVCCGHICPVSTRRYGSISQTAWDVVNFCTNVSILYWMAHSRCWMATLQLSANISLLNLPLCRLTSCGKIQTRSILSVKPARLGQLVEHWTHDCEVTGSSSAGRLWLCPCPNFWYSGVWAHHGPTGALVKNYEKIKYLLMKVYFSCVLGSREFVFDFKWIQQLSPTNSFDQASKTGCKKYCSW